MKYKIGIIGFGKMGKIRAEALSEHSNVEIRKIYDTNNKNYSSYDFQTASSPEEIIEDDQICAVVIGTPNFLNKQLTIAALQNKKHVFCEKPPALTGSDVLEIREIEKASGMKLMYGFNHRHHGSVMQMKEMIDSREYGEVLWLRGRYGKSVDKSFFEGWRSKKELSGGGILLDQGIHMLDLFLFLGGDFDQVQAMVSSLYWKLDGIEDNVFAQFRNSNSGMVASLHSTMTQWRHLFSLEVFLEKGYMVLNGLKTSSGTYGEEILTVARNRSKAPAASWDDEVRHIYSVDTSWSSECTHFIDCITNDKPIAYGTSSDALKVMNLIDKVYENDHHVKNKLFENLQ